MMSEQSFEAAGEAAAFEPMRLQRFLARAGVASRRHAEELIAAGRVRVNGEAVSRQGVKVGPDDVVEVDGQAVRLRSERRAFMLHKPRGVLSTMQDTHGRPTVRALLPPDVPGLYHAGRLDQDTSGLLLFTTDGDLGQALIHPRLHVPKRYVAIVSGAVKEAELEPLRSGMKLDGRPTQPAEAVLIDDEEALRLFDRAAEGLDYFERTSAASSARCVALTLYEGRKRQIREMFKAIGHPVIALHRYGLGHLTLGSLDVGRCRELSAAEIERLRADAGAQLQS